MALFVLGIFIYIKSPRRSGLRGDQGALETGSDIRTEAEVPGTHATSNKEVYRKFTSKKQVCAK